MSDLFPFLTQNGQISWMAVLGFVLLVLAAVWLAQKSPLRKIIPG